MWAAKIYTDTTRNAPSLPVSESDSSCLTIFQISGDTKDAAQGQQAAAKIFRLTDEPLNIDPLSEEGAKPAQTKGALGFQNIFFAYPSRPNMQVRTT